MYLEIRINKFNPLRASLFIDLPEIIKKKHAVINVHNHDNSCFKWAVLSALFPVKDNAHRIQQYETFFNTLDFTGINFPTPLRDIVKFEKMNEISINVYGLNEENKVFPLLITKAEKNKHVDLLYLKNSINNSHYCWIKNLSRLVSSQLSKSHRMTSICRRCLQHFSSENVLLKHRENCNSHGSVRIEMPKEKWLYFKNFQHTLKIPFVAYADFECFTKPISSCEPSSENSFTTLVDLEKLVINLKSDQFRNIKSFISEDKVSLLMRKRCFPYDYVSGPERLNETYLPPKEKFYSRRNDEDITDNDYQHANHVWNAFNIKTLGEYSDLYVKTDVLLLSDDFENFRSVCMKAYNLDPVWYYTAPWDSMLKFTKVKIELLMDYDMYLFVEKGIRGGISQCSNRYARANNKFLPNFEPSKPQNFLLYLDANNLYGWAMSQYLPLNDFKWVDFLDVDNIDENGEKGYILEVDLEYPEFLHDDHSDLPLAPESSVTPDVKKRDY
ncbi:uncharacterized protein TNIN_453571 [Trichonephila inaurata madagascariensis]|uniref:DNA-directed DNA polymerase n=1 Tax=Trichonephila inaurata madagascariensis TaxID=2747483 RepID=A0A8X6XFS2_9ARAC|nr:uncharacterized protein TNIN_453571 [Trichonephila inaurata madagascariensis]